MPLPVPLLPAVMLIQAALVVAIHAQPAPAVTPTLPLPALEINEAVVGVIAYVQGAPLCVTVNVWPAIVIVPVRELVLLLAATE